MFVGLSRAQQEIVGFDRQRKKRFFLCGGKKRKKKKEEERKKRGCRFFLLDFLEAIGLYFNLDFVILLCEFTGFLIDHMHARTHYSLLEYLDRGRFAARIFE